LALLRQGLFPSDLRIGGKKGGPLAAYYNERDPYAAQWLRNLIAAGHIAPGDVDDRSIEDVRPSDLIGYEQCHFFAGIGVWSHALRRAGWPDDRPVWTGSCPCQPFSAAGKRGGTADERHLWPHWFHLIQHGKPAGVPVFGEQVASKDGLAWLDLVHADLEGQGYTVRALDLCAAGVGAPHIRQRLYFVADTGRAVHERVRGPGEASSAQGSAAGEAQQRQRCGAAAGTSCASNTSGPTNGFWHPADWLPCIDGKARPVEPGTFPLAHGVAARVGRLRAYGNAIVAPLAEEFIRAYLAESALSDLL
jgi:DNA (cytosine-5)-methyltransferase 1